MADETFTVDADISQLVAELQKIQGVTKAQADSMARQLTAATSKSATGFGNLGKAVDNSGRAAVKLRGILGMLSPELASAAGLVDDLADGIEGMGIIAGGSVATALAVLAGAAAALGTAWVVTTNAAEGAAESQGVISGAMEVAEARTVAAAKAVDGLSAAWTAYRSQGRSIQQRIDDINAGLSETEIATRDAQEEIRNAAAPIIQALGTQVASTEILIAREEALLASTTALHDEKIAAAEALKRHNAALASQRKALDTEIEQRDAYMEQAAALVDFDAEIVKGKQKETEARKESAKATKEEVDARRSLYDDAIVALQAEEDASIIAATQTERERMEADHAARAAKIEDLRREALQQTTTIEGIETVEEQYRRNKKAEDERYESEKDAQDARDKERHDAALDRLEEQARAAEDAAARAKAAQMEAIDAVLGTADAGIGAVVDLLDAQAEKGGENAEKIAQAAKGIAVAQITLQGIQAAITAIGPPPTGFGPTPLGAAAAAVAAAGTAAAIAQAEAVSFRDTPGVQQMRGSGPVSLSPGDFFAAARTPQDLARQAGGGASRVQVVFRGRVLDEMMSSTIKAGGRTRKILNEGKRKPGHSHAG